jgi:hydrogenase maturation protease
MNSSATDPRVLVIGYGNPLRGDDGAGLAVAQRLDEQNLPARVVCCHQLTPELAQMLAEAELAIFIDACDDGQPGRVRCREVFANPQAGISAIDHHLSPATLLAWACDLYGRSPHAVVITIDGQAWGYTDQLSPPVAAAVGLAETAVRELIRSRFNVQHHREVRHA